MTSQLVKVHKKLAEKGDKSAEILLVSHDSNAEKQTGYLKSGGISFPVVKYAVREDEKVDAIVQTTKLDAMPFIWKIDREGKIVSDNQEEILKELAEKAGLSETGDSAKSE